MDCFRSRLIFGPSGGGECGRLFFDFGIVRVFAPAHQTGGSCPGLFISFDLDWRAMAAGAVVARMSILPGPRFAGADGVWLSGDSISIYFGFRPGMDSEFHVG